MALFIILMHIIIWNELQKGYLWLTQLINGFFLELFQFEESLFLQFTHPISMLSVVVMTLQCQLPVQLCLSRVNDVDVFYSLVVIRWILKSDWITLTPFQSRSLAREPVKLINYCWTNKKHSIPICQKIWVFMLSASERIIIDEKDENMWFLWLTWLHTW